MEKHKMKFNSSQQGIIPLFSVVEHIVPHLPLCSVFYQSFVFHQTPVNTAIRKLIESTSFFPWVSDFPFNNKIVIIFRQIKEVYPSVNSIGPPAKSS